MRPPSVPHSERPRTRKMRPVFREGLKSKSRGTFRAPAGDEATHAAKREMRTEDCAAACNRHVCVSSRTPIMI